MPEDVAALENPEDPGETPSTLANRILEDFAQLYLSTLRRPLPKEDLDEAFTLSSAERTPLWRRVTHTGPIPQVRSVYRLGVLVDPQHHDLALYIGGPKDGRPYCTHYSPERGALNAELTKELLEQQCVTVLREVRRVVRGALEAQQGTPTPLQPVA